LITLPCTRTWLKQRFLHHHPRHRVQLSGAAQPRSYCEQTSSETPWR